jgi:hypothetical protein
MYPVPWFSPAVETERIAPLPRTDGLRGVKADAPSAPEGLVAEPPPAAQGDAALTRESHEGERARTVPRVQHATPAILAWFATRWAREGLPPLGELDVRTLAARIAEGANYETLALALRRARELAKRPDGAPRAPLFAFVFGDRARFAELVHEARRSRELELFGGGPRGGPIVHMELELEPPAAAPATRRGMGRCEPRVPGLAVVVTPEPRRPQDWTPAELDAWRARELAKLAADAARDVKAPSDAGDVGDVPIVSIAALLPKPGTP